MSKIDLSEVLEDKPKKKSKNKKFFIPTNYIIFWGVLSLLFGSAIVVIVNKLVDLPFQANNRNLSIVVQDSVNVSEMKIKMVKRSFLLILPNSFWDHSNYTDIDYSNKTIGLAVNNVLGYDAKKQNWTYRISDDGVTEIVSVVGDLILDNVKYEADIEFNILYDSVFFYNLHLKEKIRRAKNLPATPRQKSLLIQAMYRG